ncbi:MAG: DUF1800 family protein [Acidimicrobiales bacterium]|nr:DUF1800 family protein [Acidimicrobiales bacterium]MDG2218759.1 DUF1800 family protein [Acidimicrobiales bacterium]
MTTRNNIALLARRVAWGLAPGQLDKLETAGTSAYVDALLDPDGAGIAAEPSPWADFDYIEDQELRQEQGLEALSRWMTHLVETERPLENTMAWFWHDHFAVSFQVAQYLPSLIDHLDLIRDQGLGDFRELIRSVSTDSAMLIFLDGATSTGDAPNENYGRELLELYTLGIGNYTEDDVAAASVALTGWVVRRRLGGEVQFVPDRHDSTPQLLLGEVVSDVDSVVDVACSHSACAGFIAAKVARFFLGNPSELVVGNMTDRFTASGLGLPVLAHDVLDAAVAGESTPQIVAPVPWLVGALKATGAQIEPRIQVGLLRLMGQVPGSPPNVGGFPGASTWLASSATAARFSAANVVARATPDDAEALILAADGDWDGLADLFLRPQGFSAATLAALRDLPTNVSIRRGEGALALSLASPDLLVA